MSQNDFFEFESEFDSLVPDITLVRSLKNKKQCEAGKELKRLEKRKLTQIAKVNATSAALIAQAEQAEQQRLTERASAFAVRTLNEPLSDSILSDVQIRRAKILNRQAAKKVVQLQRKLKSKNSTQKLQRDILKKIQTQLKNEAKSEAMKNE